MEFKSILECQEQQEDIKLKVPAFFVDLNMDQIIKLIQEESPNYDITDMFYYFPDKEGMVYRQEIYQDIKRQEIFECFENFSVSMRRSAILDGYHIAKDNEMQGCMWRMEAIYYYCKAVMDLYGALEDAIERKLVGSKGLVALHKYLSELLQESSFSDMQKTAYEIWGKVTDFRFVLSIQGNRLVIRQDATEGTYEQHLQDCFQEYHTGDKDGLRSPYMANLELDGLEKKLLTAYFAKNPALLSDVGKFTGAHTQYKKKVLVRLEKEVQFYLAYCRFQKSCSKQGFAFAKPGYNENAPMQADGVYDLALACVNYNEGKEVVSNDFTYALEEQFFVVNGPNQGGKTTFARSLGQLIYFAKMGLDVNAQSANIHYFTDLLTHFSVEESMESGQGKLMEELNRLAPIMKKECKQAFVIINELFTTAAHYDGCIMGARVLNHFANCQCKGVYVTHLRELGNTCAGVVRMAAMLDGTAAHRRTYRVIRSDAEVIGYAEDIVNKYQLSYEDLHERLKVYAMQEGGQQSC